MITAVMPEHNAWGDYPDQGTGLEISSPPGPFIRDYAAALATDVRKRF